jgi:hypothetical protein
MNFENRSQYCVFYSGKDGELTIRENIGVNDLAKIFKEAKVAELENEVLAFNMNGISQVSDITSHPENTYALIMIKQGIIQVYESIDSDSDLEDLLTGADHYYIVDDIFIISDDALHRLMVE